jgi:hypothetical protein
MQFRRFVSLAVVLLAGSVFAAAQSETTRKDQPQNQTTDTTAPKTAQSQSGVDAAIRSGSQSEGD